MLSRCCFQYFSRPACPLSSFLYQSNCTFFRIIYTVLFYSWLPWQLLYFFSLYIRGRPTLMINFVNQKKKRKNRRTALFLLGLKCRLLILKCWRNTVSLPQIHLGERSLHFKWAITFFTALHSVACAVWPVSCVFHAHSTLVTSTSSIYFSFYFFISTLFSLPFNFFIH
jgi:hypothetical protein